MDPFRLASHEVHSWWVTLDVPPETSAALDVTLSADERARSARLRFARDRRRFIAARGALRGLLGRYLGASPGRIRFVHNAFGKPELSPEFGSRLRFNLSHSADRALIGVTMEADIGVDLECIRPQADCVEIARTFFSATELDELNGLPSPVHTLAFLSGWTKKEAYVKARGAGLAIPLTSFSVRLAADPAYTFVHLDRRWSLYTLQPVPSYIAALAIEGTGWRLCQWHWQPANARVEP